MLRIAFEMHSFVSLAFNQRLKKGRKKMVWNCAILTFGQSLPALHYGSCRLKTQYPSQAAPVFKNGKRKVINDFETEESELEQ